MALQDQSIPSLVVTKSGDAITMVFESAFDSAHLQQDWARLLLAQFPGPYSSVRLDLSAGPRLSSLFFAGLMLLHFTYTRQGLPRLILVKADARTYTNLRILRLDQLFGFEN
jgi:hypothetical protein